ncbi:vitamin B12-dependent ribonucleotide reductase [Candidatus Woesearchaeota archaeon]|nr:vitamin B12-dependent ribonucleotide reductase [Candidatus Woesearchaeota archaeon]
MEKEELVRRVYTQRGIDPLDGVTYEKRESRVLGRDGQIKFEQKDVEVPSSWSQLATDILAEKYFMKKGVPRTGREVSARQVVNRVSNTIRTEGERLGYFASKEEAETFEAELSHMLINQYGAFNSPVWFNMGHYQHYGITGDSKHNYYWNTATNKVEKVNNTYEHPQCSACFILSAPDSLEGMMDLQKAEVMLFKGGSGTGTNFSTIRGAGEKLSSGGKSSGLMSFLKGYDAWAGAIKSGGTTRRAAKMVILDIDHPEIESFITLKAQEEQLVDALVKAGYSSDMEGEAYQHAWGQNANNSVRISDDFMRAVMTNGVWTTKERTTGNTAKECKARDLWGLICKAAWESADPGLQFDTTINKWHTSKETGRIDASNPCSEYMFLNDSACNLASLNLMKFLKDDGSFDVGRFRHACETFILAQEILVDASSYPTDKIAQNSHDFRPLGLGYANLGTLLMVNGIPYDSDTGRAMGAAITAIMTGSAYAQSARIAARRGAFTGYERNKAPMLEVMKMHRDSTGNIGVCPKELGDAARAAWNEAVELGERHGYRNAQATVIAPTGTIGLLMDCDTTGIEPDFALVKTKKMAGGGHVTIINQSVPIALRNLGYNDKQVQDITTYMLGTRSFSPEMEKQFRKLGFTDEDIGLAKVYIEHQKRWTDMTKGVSPKLLRAAGAQDVAQLEKIVNGHGHIEGAPHLRQEHYAVFDCANKAGDGKRFIAPMGHVRMMAACQPFISGAISKTVNMPEDATIEDVANIYLESWKLGIKAIALYRDGCKKSQPLNTKTSEAEQGLPWGRKKALESIREGITIKAKIGDHSLIVRTGEYPDGTLGEFFVDMFKDGSEFKDALHSWSVSSSKGLQHGWGLEDFVDTYIYTKSAPSGFTDHPYIKSCTSVYDFVAKVLALEYLARSDVAQVKPDAAKLRVNKLKARMQEKPVVTPVKQETTKQEVIAGGPPCTLCGFSTVQNGTCHKCINCGATLGCS